jgi:hypothetical protein
MKQEEIVELNKQHENLSKQYEKMNRLTYGRLDKKGK